MTEDTEDKIFPSQFMRNLRPEYYSDTQETTSYLLDQNAFEYHLDTITSRNQQHDFEIFCRKLCERTICPNLRPQTGPEGGGDGKADTETLPVSDEISSLTYIGDANAGSERWAFAFSAKKRWKDKVRSDVDGIVTTKRGYEKIFCVTSQFARAKDRADLEDKLKQKHGIPVTILDRSWIVEKVIDGDRKDIAFNYLNVGHESQDSQRLGPVDYSRTRQLDDLEEVIADPTAFRGMEAQLVTEALVAAKLSRNLELPRTETEGRFNRAIRLADAHGAHRQKLEVRYEAIWTAFWWFDDVVILNASYDEFEALVIDDSHAINLEFLSNLLQILFNAVIHGHLSREDGKLDDRAEKLAIRLQELTEEEERPNNSLEAKTSLLIVRMNQTVLAQDRDGISEFWPQFSAILEQAKGLGEYAAERLVKLIEVFGQVAGNDPAYNALVEDVAAFVANRTSEGEGALILLKRAQQLDFEDHFDMIRLLGKAARQLTKKEYVEPLIEAMQLLSLAYRSAGLYWAARASSIFALASIIIESEEESELRIEIIPTMHHFAWISLQLRHLPDFLQAIQLLNGIARRMPLAEESKTKLENHIQQLDMCQASRLINSSPSELASLEGLPDIFEVLGLFQSRSALLYVLGYESVLREDGYIPEEETGEKVAEFYSLLASQPVSDDLNGPLVLNDDSDQTFVTTVLGIQINVNVTGSTTSILVAETVLGTLEAYLATAVELNIHPHTEQLQIAIVERENKTRPEFTLDPENMTAELIWPAGKSPASFGFQVEAQQALMELAGITMTSVCEMRNFESTLEHLYSDEAVLERISMIAVLPNSFSRVFGDSMYRLDNWSEFVRSSYPLQADRPSIQRRKLVPLDDEVSDNVDEPDRQYFGMTSQSHRDISVRSVIDIHLWNQAGWKGVAYLKSPRNTSAAIALLFTNENAARKIFERWRERFGSVDKEEDIYVAIIKNISDKHHFHYKVMITSRPWDDDVETIKASFFLSRIQTMEPDSDINLERFLTDYDQNGTYELLPAIWKGNETPDLLFEQAILKRQLSVKSATDVGPQDIEMMALPDMARAHFKMQDDE